MSSSSSFSTLFPSNQQRTNSVQTISSLIPGQNSQKNEKKQYEINPELILSELNSRFTTPPRPQSGFKLPDPVPAHQYCWPTHGYKDTNSENGSQTFFLDQETNEEPKFTFVRMGDTSIQNIVKYGRTPELPHRTRVRPRSKMSSICPHYNERLTPRAGNKPPSCKSEIKIKHSNQREENEFFSWKYFGNTDDVCGCYTAKIPMSMKEQASAKTISRLPNGSNKLKKINRKFQPRKHQNQILNVQNKNHHLFDKSIENQKTKIELRDIVESNQENSDFDQFINSETDSYIEYKGKMIPLKSSNLSRFASGI